MQPTSRVVGAFEGANNPSSEPPDVFCGLASLIVEGRIPRNDGRGYGEGPHVPQTASKALSSRHAGQIQVASGGPEEPDSRRNI